MCQGLPCLGARVRLQVEVSVGSDLVSASTVGEVIQEHLGTREISVSVTTRRGNSVVVRVDENLVQVLDRPASEPGDAER
jgi:hypothetical protein